MSYLLGFLLFIVVFVMICFVCDLFMGLLLLTYHAFFKPKSLRDYLPGVGEVERVQVAQDRDFLGPVENEALAQLEPRNFEELILLQEKVQKLEELFDVVDHLTGLDLMALQEVSRELKRRGKIE